MPLRQVAEAWRRQGRVYAARLQFTASGRRLFRRLPEPHAVRDVADRPLRQVPADMGDQRAGGGSRGLRLRRLYRKARTGAWRADAGFAPARLLGDAGRLVSVPD